MIVRGVVGAINVRRHNVAELDHHVVRCGSDGPSSHGIGVAGLQTDLDGVDIRVSEQKGEDSVPGPRRFAFRESNQGYEENHDPDLRISTDFHSMVALDFFTDPCRKQELNVRLPLSDKGDILEAS